jgi:hypothetical protein
MDAKEVSNTILQQLGGNHFAGMTGAKNFTIVPFTENYPCGGLTFTVNTRGWSTSGINHVKVILEGNDTYTMYFSKVKKAKIIKGKFYDGSVILVKKIENTYFDDLQNFFEAETNLLTTLYPR